MPRRRIDNAPDPELTGKWEDWTIGLGTLIGVVGGIALNEHLKGNEQRELGSYYRTLQQLARQGIKLKTDPSSVFIELPENRAFTRRAARAARTSGIQIHQEEDELPRFYKSFDEVGTYALIPQCVDKIRTWGFRGGSGFYYEELDLLVGEGIRTVSALVGKENTMSTYKSPERSRSLRILSCYSLGQQIMEANDLKYEPPQDTSQ